MISDFAQETLDLARSLTAHKVEVSYVDADGCQLFVGDHCTVDAHCANAQATLDIYGEFDWTFGNVTAAIQAADAYETVMVAIRAAAKASREKVTA